MKFMLPMLFSKSTKATAFQMLGFSVFIAIVIAMASSLGATHEAPVEQTSPSNSSLIGQPLHITSPNTSASKAAKSSRTQSANETSKRYSYDPSLGAQSTKPKPVKFSCDNCTIAASTSSYSSPTVNIPETTVPAKPPVHHTTYEEAFQICNRLPSNTSAPSACMAGFGYTL